MDHPFLRRVVFLFSSPRDQETLIRRLREQLAQTHNQNREDSRASSHQPEETPNADATEVVDANMAESISSHDEEADRSSTSDGNEADVGGAGPDRDIFARIPPELLVRANVPQNAFDSALACMTIAANAFCAKVQDAIDIAIEQMKSLDVKALVLALVEWVCKNPRKALMIVGSILVPVLCTLLAPALLGLLGFSAAGPVAGSIAAAIQASIGNVAAGSLFAILQSAAMGGFGAPIVAGVTWGVTSLVCWGVTVFKLRKKGDGNDDSNDTDKQLFKRE